MPWFPIGPGFVFVPRNPDFKRLSRHNEYGRQGLAKCIAVDQTNPETIYVVDRPTSGGAAVFRTDNGGRTWKCISDTLHQSTTPKVDPIWIAINPVHPSTIYLTTHTDQGLYISNDKGDTWQLPKKPIPARVFKLIVDPRKASNKATTHLLVATENGVYLSNDAGDNWSKQVDGHAFSLAAYIPNSGTGHFYAGITSQGLYHTTDPASSWTNLNDQNIGLPQFVAGDGKNQEDNFQRILVDVCPQNPNRAYAWLAKPQKPNNNKPYVTEGIYTTASPTTKWEKITVPDTTLSAITQNTNPQSATPASMTGIGRGVNLTVDEGSQQESVSVISKTATTFTAIFKKDHADGAKIQIKRPNPAQGWYNYTFAVAPNSPGDGQNDILFFGRIQLFRSKDGGVTWEEEAWDYPNRVGNVFHADQHAFAFYPNDPPPGTIPIVYIGCDGGISKSSKYCDPAFDLATLITDYNEGDMINPSGLPQNLNHGRQCSALYQYTSYPDLSALGYIGCQDTGVNGGVKTFGWRGLADADGGPIAIAPGKDSLIVWGNLGSPFYMQMWTDKGDLLTDQKVVKLGNNKGPWIKTTGNYELSPGDTCLTGAYVFSPETTLLGPITNDANPQTVTPASMNGIQVGSVLTVDEGDNLEYVTVTATTKKTFTAVFTIDHNQGVKVLVNRNFIVRVDQDGIAHKISQDFGPEAYPGERYIRVIIAPHPTNPDYIVCATGVDGYPLHDKVWYTNAGSTATASTTWYEVVGNKPQNADINSIAITPNFGTYLLLRNPVQATSTRGAKITTPLFKLAEDMWVPQVCIDNPPTTDYPYGKLVAHPKRDDTLFASHAGSVYKLEYIGGKWKWTDMSQGLPGQVINDLWIGFISQDKKEEDVILRAGISTRGVWEYLLTYGEDVPFSHVYMRDHLLDQGLLLESEGGMKNPYDPKQTVRHYHCADIKIDVQQPGKIGVAPFFQTDPEGGKPPFSHILFDQLRDHSQSLAPGLDAFVHAKVNNRSYGTIDNVYVWAIYCNAAAGVPSLSKSVSNGNNFQFWDQFVSPGAIIPNLPADSPWKALGDPVVLDGLDVFNPQVASWKWKIPTLATGDPGHYCIVVFVHGGACPINKTGYNVDYICPINRQIGQKNLHISPPLSSGGSGGGGGASPSAPQPQMKEYVEFHNSEKEARIADLFFDFSNLPPELAVTLQLTHLTTRLPLEMAMNGIKNKRRAKNHEKILPRSEPTSKNVLGHLGKALRDLINWVLRLFGAKPGDRRYTPKIAIPKFVDIIYEVKPRAQVTVRDVQFDPFGMVAAYIRIRNTGFLPKGERYQFEVQQLIDGEPVGGSTYIVVIEGDPELPPLQQFPFIMMDKDPIDWSRIEWESKEDKYIPPWAVDIVKRREAETEK
jgi:photosystem II stability/assembly factor-like uncharacterized protein